MSKYLNSVLFILFSHSIFAGQLPLSFVVQPQVATMAVGQQQTLSYVIRNNTRHQVLPLKSIQVVNFGDYQAANVVTMQSSCGAALTPSATCGITVTIRDIGAGVLNRALVIDYNGRAPLVAPMNMLVSQAAYTILVYIIGSDLEVKNADATANILQMMEVGSDKNMNVIIETGGAKPKPGWSTVKRQLVLPGKLEEIIDLGDVPMGGSQPIQSFMEWGMTHYPADRYIIAYWDHGGGPNGGFGDNDNSISIQDFKTATSNAYLTTGKTFEIIGFDACYLGNIETFSGIYPYTNYLIGSEDTEPGKSWQYNTFLDYVTHNPHADGLAVGEVIIDGYTEQNEGSSTTLSITASADMPALLQAIRNFSTALAAQIVTPNQWLQIARARYKAPDYGTSVWDNKSFDAVDLAEFGQAIYTNFTGVVQEAAEQLVLATNQAVKYFRNSSNRAASHGLTIYFPSILSSYPSTGYPTNVAGLFPAEYISLVNGYYAYYQSNQASLEVALNNFMLNAGNYSVEIAGASFYDELYAGVGEDDCILPSVGTVPCIKTLQNPNVTDPGVSGVKIFNKAANINSWPKINNTPVILIPNDTDPNTTDEGESFLVPVEDGYLSVIKNDNEYEVVGFQENAGSANTQSKIVPINPNTQIKLRVFANNAGTWQLLLSNVIITSPFTVSFGNLDTDFDAFRFIVSDLTGRLVVTGNSAPY